MKKLSKSLSVLTILVVIGSLFAGSAFAAKPSNNNRPGWGHGDDNHHHTGPPGLSDRFDKDGDHDVTYNFHDFFGRFFAFFHHNG